MLSVVWFMALNATFNNISVISWRSVLLVEETGVSGQKTTDLSQVTDTLYNIMLYRYHNFSECGQWREAFNYKHSLNSVQPNLLSPPLHCGSQNIRYQTHPKRSMYMYLCKCLFGEHNFPSGRYMEKQISFVFF